MQSFSDRNGRVWPIVVTFDSLRHVRKVLGIDLLSRDGIATATDSLIDTVDVLYLICNPDPERPRESAAKFGELIADPEVLQTAINAWLEAMEDFFRLVGRQSLATLARATIDEERTIESRLQATATPGRITAAVSAKVDREISRIDRELSRLSTSGTEPTNSPASSASTPDL